LKYTDPSGFETEGEYDGDREAGGASDNQAEVNDFNGSEESGDGSKDSFEDRARYDSRITEQNNKELSRLNLQYKVDTVTRFLSELFNVFGMIIGALAPKSLKGINQKQLNNIKRFNKKIPANSKKSIEIEQAKDSLTVRATSPGNVPGSKAVYEKQMDINGVTTKYTKTTYDPKGNVVHEKNKMK
jgi:hypothetical protein